MNDVLTIDRAVAADDLCRAVATAVVDALSAAHIDVKVAADIMGLGQTRLYQQLQGDSKNPIALWRLLRLPLPFWFSFLPWLLYRIGQQRVQEIRRLPPIRRHGLENPEEAVRQAVRDAMLASGLTMKDAAARIGRDESDLRKALRGAPHHYLPLSQIVATWPFEFWRHCAPSLLAIVAKRRMVELREDVAA